MIGEFTPPHGYKGIIVEGGKKLIFAGSILDIKKTKGDVMPSNEEERQALRGYPLKRELKTLLRKDNKSGMYFMVQVPGDKSVDNAAIKNILKKEFDVKKPDIIKPSLDETLELFRCTYGTTNPFNNYTKDLPQLVSADLLDIVEDIGTNAGTLDTYVQFDPKLFLEMPKHTEAKLFVDEFSRNEL